MAQTQLETKDEEKKNAQREGRGVGLLVLNFFFLWSARDARRNFPAARPAANAGVHRSA